MSHAFLNKVCLIMQARLYGTKQRGLGIDYIYKFWEYVCKNTRQTKVMNLAATKKGCC